VYSDLHNCRDVLSGVKVCPAKADTAGLIKEPQPLKVTTLEPGNKEHVKVMKDRKEFDDMRRSVNANIKKDVKKQNKRIRY
jgi:hypothetical protein